MKEKKYCRICMETSKPLIHPCRCSGSLKFVHEKCLKTWLTVKSDEIEYRHCEICHVDFVMEFRYSTRCSPSEICDHKLGYCLFLLLLLLVLCLLSLLIAVISQILMKSEGSKRAYALTLLIICCFSSVILIVLVISAFRKACFINKITRWRILSQETNNKTDNNSNIITVEDYQPKTSKFVTIRSKKTRNALSFHFLHTEDSTSNRRNIKSLDHSNISV